MAKVYDSILDLVGKTPLVELKRIEEKEGLQAKLIAKVESFNPAGSVKDRIAKAMIEDAEAKGLLKEGSVIIEPTSGNTGIGLAAAATVKGYRMILTMPETMSVERRNIVKAYGAEVVLTDGTKGMKGAIDYCFTPFRDRTRYIIRWFNLPHLLPGTMRFQVVFCHHINAVLIAKIIPWDLVGIMASSNSVDIVFFESIDIFFHIVQGNATASFGIPFMAINSVNN